jgi:TRAP-type C4-dicarboxylate transport system substrate-binding protein
MNRRCVLVRGVRDTLSATAMLVIIGSGLAPTISAQDSSPLATPVVASPTASGALEGDWQTPHLDTAQIRSALEAAGLPPDGIDEFLAGQGWTDDIVWSIRLKDGDYSLMLSLDGGPAETLDHGRYEVVDDHTLVETNDCCVVTFDYSLSGDTLDLRQVDQSNGSSDDDYYGVAIFGVAPFQRVASAPVATAAQDPASLTLTLAIANEQGEPSQPAIDAFIEQVATLSDGGIAIEPLYGAGNATEEGFEHGVALLVERGEADLGLNASRAWDLAGVTSLQALQAPFLISDSALAAAVAESDIAERALAGMADAGVVGLSLWPEDLRHPFALGDHAPFLSPADFDGATILVQPSALSRALVTTLGGALYVDGDRALDAAEGRLHGAESGLLQGHTLPGSPIATGDVTFYPKFQMLVANAAMFDGLTPEQQDILRAAAVETRRLSIEAHSSEADAAATWCANGNAIALAGEAGVAAFEAAAQPVFEQIEQDPLTAELIADIRALKATTEPAPGATACSAAVATPGPSLATGEVTPIDGTYTTSFTREELAASPLLYDQGEINDGNWGDMTVMFDRGSFTGELTNPTTDSSTTGTYSVDGDLLLIVIDQGGGPETFGFRWSLQGDTLTFTRDPGHVGPTPFLVKAWTRAD